jgi:ribosome-associated heat shock protein Hsp15
MNEDACRIDVWLWRARFLKSRNLAARLVEEGRVRLTRGGRETRIEKPGNTI